MTKRKFFQLILFSLFCALGITFCTSNREGKHLIENKQQRARIEKDFNERAERLQYWTESFQAEIDSLPLVEREAMMFLLAYSPLSDLPMLRPEIYKGEVRAALRARREMTWGKRIPEREFLHFVLPNRVNNEPLECWREEFYEELKERIAGLSLREAALEVNHWCHEWVTYAPSDSRTRTPLQTKRNALGRCGEESVFTVAALRAVGIPARQVYTPRWAHTDDNHAWVEVWIDGKWHFMGACEPAANLDMAWFNSSVVRAMLVHTKVFGYYEGEEDIIQRTPTFTEINCIDNYVPTRRLNVAVYDMEGKSIPDASVHYSIYNYAEFYPVASLKSNAQGESALTVGRGDMIVWAAKGEKLGYAISKGDATETLKITLQSFEELPEEVSFKIVPPTGDPLPMTASESAIQENEKRLIQEDEIRKAYEKTFDAAINLDKKADEWELPKSELARIFRAARANTTNLIQFLDKAKNKRAALDFLNILNDKDLSDIANLNYPIPDSSTPFERMYRYNPRISNEPLGAGHWSLTPKVGEQQKTPQEIFAMLSSKTCLDDQNLNGTIMQPSEVLSSKYTDMRSLKVAYIALMRREGYAARINEETGHAEYSLDQGKSWIRTDFEAPQKGQPSRGMITVIATGTQKTKYYSHFTVARMSDTNPFPQTLYYNNETPISADELFQQPQQVETGNYVIVTGNRMASGAVAVQMKFFTVSPNQKRTEQLELPEDAKEIAVIGSIDAEKLYTALPSKKQQSILSTTGRGYFILAILKNGTEPTTHALKDLEQVSAHLNQWGRPFLFLFPNESDWNKFSTKDFPNLPQNQFWGIDTNGAIQKMIGEAVNTTNDELPIVIVADSFGRVVFVRKGYTIGLGEQILSILPQL